MLRLTGRYFRTIPIDNTGYQTESIALDPARTAFVAMHCWDIGCEGGPAIDPRFCVGMGYYESFREAERMINECIAPAMAAARRVGVLVCHVESPTIGQKHPEARLELDPPSPPAGGTARPEVVPGWRAQIVARSHGANYAAESPYARMDRARRVAPLHGEIFAYQTGQLDRLLRGRGIENLIYSGFAADMCVLRAPGGIEPMAPFGYRLFLMRDATLGVECPDTFRGRIATRWAIRYFESHYGDTILCSDFIHACETRP
jgi:nicotinamidase-related amidase